MEMTNEIPPSVLKSAVLLLQPYVKDLSEDRLVEAVKNYDPYKIESQPPTLFDIYQTSKFLGVSRDTLLRMIDSGEIRAVKIRYQWRIRSDEIRRIAYNDHTPE